MHACDGLAALWQRIVMNVMSKAADVSVNPTLVLGHQHLADHQSERSGNLGSPTLTPSMHANTGSGGMQCLLAAVDLAAAQQVTGQPTTTAGVKRAPSVESADTGGSSAATGPSAPAAQTVLQPPSKRVRCSVGACMMLAAAAGAPAVTSNGATNSSGSSGHAAYGPSRAVLIPSAGAVLQRAGDEASSMTRITAVERAGPRRQPSVLSPMACPAPAPAVPAHPATLAQPVVLVQQPQPRAVPTLVQQQQQHMALQPAQTAGGAPIPWVQQPAGAALPTCPQPHAGPAAPTYVIQSTVLPGGMVVPTITSSHSVARASSSATQQHAARMHAMSAAARPATLMRQQQHAGAAHQQMQSSYVVATEPAAGMLQGAGSPVNAFSPLAQQPGAAPPIICQAAVEAALAEVLDVAMHK